MGQRRRRGDQVHYGLSIRLLTGQADRLHELQAAAPSATGCVMNRSVSHADVGLKEEGDRSDVYLIGQLAEQTGGLQKMQGMQAVATAAVSCQ